MKRSLALLLPLTLLLSAVSCSQNSSQSDTSSDTVSSAVTTENNSADSSSGPDSEVSGSADFASMEPEEIVGQLTIEQKAAQMVQPAVYNVSEEDMTANDYGSILSTVGCIDSYSWRQTVDRFQKAALQSDAGIPYIYGQDDVHGVNYCLNAVYFPHNIGQGAANDAELAYQVGLITADEAKLCHMMWNFSPCVAQSVDPRWGRTYESYGSDLDTITKLSTAYTKGLIDGGIVACAKHFFGDGNVCFNTGEQGDISMLIDRGDARLSEDEINELLKVYQAQIDAGVQTIMISHSSLNGVKMHENKEYIMKLKNEMGFDGFIVSDWGSVGNITGSSYKEQVIKSVNAGIDMLMETDKFDEAKQIIIDAAGSGDIPKERIDDAVTRIIRVKKNAGLFDDPMLENLNTKQQETGSLEYRKVAEKLVEKSLVLLKNDNDVLPLKEGSKVYITGPAANNCQAQCGGWTMDWNGPNSKDVPGVTTITEAFERYAEDYGITVITDPESAQDADVVLLCIGEIPYAEWNGDTEDMTLFGKLGLPGNSDAIHEAQELGKPTVTCIVAGRNVILNQRYYKNWDSVVMCYLPGSEGKGISDVLCGCADFYGKLPSPWYMTTSQIGSDDSFLERGYGLSYGDSFSPKTEPDTILDPPTEFEPDEAVAGTDYAPGLFKDGVYVNDYAGIKINVPGNLQYFPQIEGEKQEYIDQLTDEKEIAFEKSIVWDLNAGNISEAIGVSFVNTNMLLPDESDVTEERALDAYNDWLTGLVEAAGESIIRQNRAAVKLGDKEFIRNVYYYSENSYEAFYLRKIDNDLMCCFYCTSNDPEKNPEYYEKCFS